MHPACFVFPSTIPAPGRVVKKNFQISALFPAGGGIARKNAAGESAAADAAGQNAGKNAGVQKSILTTTILPGKMYPRQSVSIRTARRNLYYVPLPSSFLSDRSPARMG